MTSSSESISEAREQEDEARLLSYGFLQGGHLPSSGGLDHRIINNHTIATATIIVVIIIIIINNIIRFLRKPQKGPAFLMLSVSGDGFRFIVVVIRFL